MSDYFEKLGNLLNEALENGEIPQEKVKTTAEETVSKEPFEQSYNTNESKPSQEKQEEPKIRRHFFKRKEIPTAQVIKSETIQQNFIPPAVIQALNLLNLSYPCTWKTVHKQYHTMLKQLHPDTKKSEQQNTTQINDLQNAYQLLKQFFGK